MPYTPPSQRSPASSKSNSPILSRSHSFSEGGLSPQSASAAHRPVLPHSSASYLSKHRRTPSISQSPQDGSKVSVTHTNGSAHHANLPSMKLLIPVGAESTPPDSVQNSDDEDRGRQSGKLAELQEALQSIEVKRGHSPERHPDGPASAPRESVPVNGPIRPALTPEARKISHSRSSSEIQLSKHAPSLSESPIQSTDESEEEGLSMKPPLLRKKSGELVKPALRPSSRNRRRPSSMPGTPSFSKAVHFNDDIEQVRHFLQVDRPIAVSAGSSPVETYDSETEYPFGYDDGNGYSSRRSRVEWELRLANFPRETFERKTLPVRVEKIALSPDSSTLVGTVAVANLAFHKAVVARFTLDYWKTTSEVAAEYSDDVRRKQTHDGCDRFVFNIKLADQANLESKTMLLCIRYTVGGAEYWDNNNSMNFQVDFIKKTTPPKNTRSKQRPAGTLGAIPRSRHSPPAARPRSMPVPLDDDFGNNFESSRYTFGSRDSNDGLQPPIKLRSKTKPSRSNLFPDQPDSKPSPTQKAFSTRYDFSTSLSQALSSAQTAMGDRSGIKRTNKPRAGDYFTLQGEAPAPTKSTSPRPDQLSSVKPDLKSAEYNELIQKYCFVRPPAPTTTANTTTTQAGH
ncbi:Protein phosphatase 1 regulatory subunit 3A [Diplodia seriata]|uniref:Protein phosphatase 1 regulatory subunit 3A n=2 Tax=Diplodia seriata TaxID=420778 RepID=A0A1S8B7M3_9PEZI|nr:Protein phosphatase 1 regulatory subunit 3A [Diplodia seriata]